MNEIRKQLEQALAYLHAVLDDGSALDVVEARRNADKLLGAVVPKAVSLSDARQLYEYLGQLRALVRILDSRLALRSGSVA